MPRSLLNFLARCLLGIASSAIVIGAMVSPMPAGAADLPSMTSRSAMSGAEFRGGNVYQGSGGFRVARIPVRPVPIRYDIYGYPLLAGAPDPLATGSGCPAALEPDFDPDGNFAGYAPVPMCR